MIFIDSSERFVFVSRARRKFDSLIGEKVLLRVLFLARKEKLSIRYYIGKLLLLFARSLMLFTHSMLIIAMFSTSRDLRLLFLVDDSLCGQRRYDVDSLNRKLMTLV